VYCVEVPASLITRLLILAVVDAAMCNGMDPRGVWDGSLHFFDKVPLLHTVRHPKHVTKTPPNSPIPNAMFPRAPYILY